MLCTKYIIVFSTTDCIQDQQANHYNTAASGNKYTTDEYIGCAINKDMHARGSLQVRLYVVSVGLLFYHCLLQRVNIPSDGNYASFKRIPAGTIPVAYIFPRNFYIFLSRFISLNIDSRCSLLSIWPGLAVFHSTKYVLQRLYGHYGGRLLSFFLFRLHETFKRLV
jgi:hypothetical protein